MKLQIGKPPYKFSTDCIGRYRCRREGKLKNDRDVGLMRINPLTFLNLKHVVFRMMTHKIYQFQVKTLKIKEIKWDKKSLIQNLESETN